MNTAKTFHITPTIQLYPSPPKRQLFLTCKSDFPGTARNRPCWSCDKSQCRFPVLIFHELPGVSRRFRFKTCQHGVDFFPVPRFFTAETFRNNYFFHGQYSILYPGDTGLAERLAGKNSAREVLKFLRDELDKAPIKFR